MLFQEFKPGSVQCHMQCNGAPALLIRQTEWRQEIAIKKAFAQRQSLILKQQFCNYIFKICDNFFTAKIRFFQKCLAHKG